MVPSQPISLLPYLAPSQIEECVELCGLSTSQTKLRRMALSGWGSRFSWSPLQWPSSFCIQVGGLFTKQMWVCMSGGGGKAGESY